MDAKGSQGLDLGRPPVAFGRLARAVIGSTGFRIRAGFNL